MKAFIYLLIAWVFTCFLAFGSMSIWIKSDYCRAFGLTYSFLNNICVQP